MVMPMTTTNPFFIGQVERQNLQFDAWQDVPLLQSMEQGGIDWPSSCRVGNCRTCVGQLISGSVRYTIEWPGLTTEEQDEGCVLPCVAIPCSDIVLRPGY